MTHNPADLESNGPVSNGPLAPKKLPKTSAVTPKTKEIARNKRATVSRNPDKASKKPAPSKTETLVGLLERSKGASLDEMMKATGWQTHSVRGFLSAVIKKKLRLKLVSEEDSKGTRRYRVKSRAKA